jgi:maltoporin
VHIVDTFFVNMTGTGGGADIGLGGKPDAKDASGPTLGIAFFRSDSSTAAFGGFPATSGGNSSTGAPGSRINVDLRDLTVAPNNKLRFTGAYTKGDFDAAHSPNGLAGTNGWAGSVQWNFDIPAIGGGNVMWLQYSQGSAFANGGFGGLTDPSSTKTERIIESVQWQVGNFGGQGILGYTQHKSTAGTLKYTSIGGRGSWAFTNNFKLVGEAGYDKVNAAVGPNTNMFKLTVAPTVAFDKGFWARPEIRLYGTYGTWNDGANQASGPTGYADLNNAKNAFTYGIQIEAWW